MDILNAEWQATRDGQDGSSKQTIRVRRRYIREDAVHVYNRGNFKCLKDLRVNFIGEEGIDLGGPRREYFTLILDEIKSRLFFGKSGHRVPIHDATKLREGWCRFVGSVCGQCLLMEKMDVGIL